MKTNKTHSNESTLTKLTIYGGSFIALGAVVLGVFLYLLNQIAMMKAKSTTGNIPQLYNAGYWILLIAMIIAFVAGLTMLIISLIIFLKKRRSLKK